MAVSLFALLRRLRSVISGRSPSAAPAPARRPLERRPVDIQSLEGRRMFNGGRDALVVTEQLIGPETAITSVVLTFTQSLNAASADNPNSYGIVCKVNQPNTGSRGTLGSLSPFGGENTTPTAQSIIAKHVRILSAVFDPATMTVTL